MVREASGRTLGQRHFDVQLIGGIVLHQGKIAEMETGEGKTLVATLPALPERPHRAGRPPGHGQRLPGPARPRVDGRDLRFLGLTVGVHRARAGRRRAPPQAYGCDITYGTNNEFGFDYLRDNMGYRPERHGAAGASTTPSWTKWTRMLIDEARTPLIISRPGASTANRRLRRAEAPGHPPGQNAEPA